MTNIPVFLASDNNYAPFVASTIASICDNTKSFIDFYILDSGISKGNQIKIELLKNKFKNFSVEFIEIDLDKEFKGFYISAHLSLATYSRFLIPNLKPELNKVIYSDVDVVAMGDIAEMYKEDLKGYGIAGVWESKYEKGFNIERKIRLGLKDTHRYFCAGHLIIDSQYWRNNNIIKDLLDIASNNQSILKGHDQDALNIYFNDNYLDLPLKYSFVYPSNGKELEEPIIIRHYTKVKPWDISPDIDNRYGTDHEIFWKYAEMTAFYNEIKEKTKYNDLHSLRNRVQVLKIMEKYCREKS